MTTKTADTVSTRRSFLKGGAVVAAPLAAAAAPALAMAADHEARAARLEDEAAIRELHQTWLRRINAGAQGEAAELFADPRRAALDHGVCAIAADHAGAPDRLELAADGRSAAGRFHCTIEVETALPRGCTLAQMAYAQGGGFVRRTERIVLTAEYAKARGVWAIAKLEFSQA